MIDAVGQRAWAGELGRSGVRPRAPAEGFPAAAERALAAEAAKARAPGGAGRRAEVPAWLDAVEGSPAEALRGPGELERAEAAAASDEAACESAPSASAAAASAAVRIALSRGDGGRAALELRIGDWLHVRLAAGERGVAISIGCDRAVAPLLDRALPRLLRDLRARGIAVARAEVVPFSHTGRRPSR